MEYEAYEPDPEDEYYDDMCSCMYATLWNERRNTDGWEDSYPCDQRPVLYAAAC